MQKASRFAAMIVYVLVATLLVACGGAPAPAQKPATPTPAPAPAQKDGTYFGTTPADERGSYGVAEVKIEGGKVTTAKYTEINGANLLPKSKENGYTHEAALKAFDGLPKSYLKTLDLNKVDNITGATNSVKMFKEAIRSALAQASPTYKAGVMRDGTYKLNSGTDSKGYFSVLTLTVKDNKFEKLEYQEYEAKSGKSKKEIGYNHAGALKAIEDLPKKMNEVRDVTKVDVITGATGTSNKFKAMTRFAIDLSRARDGVYNLKSEKDQRGNWHEASLGINAGKIVGYRYVEYNGATGKPKAAPEYSHAPALKFLNESTKQAVKNQFGVDFVAGATASYNEHAAVLRKLLDAALK